MCKFKEIGIKYKIFNLIVILERAPYRIVADHLSTTLKRNLALPINVIEKYTYTILTCLYILNNKHTYSVQEYIIGIHRTAVPNVKKQHEYDRISFNPVAIEYFHHMII